MPEEVQDVSVRPCSTLSTGNRPEGARSFGEGLPRQVMRLAEDFHRDTYRAAYTVVLEGAVYVLHVFKKKSKAGIATPQPDRELIRGRLRAAEAHQVRFYEGEGQ
ncbi:MAG: addiction module toxin RelE [Gemmatimonas sp.]|nr:addiction module toxin RelE [Gemmatimonas sp.]